MDPESPLTSSRIVSIHDALPDLERLTVPADDTMRAWLDEREVTFCHTLIAYGDEVVCLCYAENDEGKRHVGPDGDVAKVVRVVPGPLPI